MSGAAQLATALAAVERTAAGALQEGETMGTNKETGAQPRRVLLVDDNDDASELLAQLLARDGDLVVSTACSGAEALQRAQACKPHVVVLDLGLPDMDGYEVMQRLKRSPELCDTVFIALTGRSRQTDLEQTRIAGFDQHFVKPPDLQALRAAVRQAR